MRILFVTGEYPPQTGGVGAYTAELARALSTLGVECAVVTSRASALAPRLEGANAGEDRVIGPVSIELMPVIERWGIGAVATVSRLAQVYGAEWIHLQYQTAAYGMNPAVNFATPFWRQKCKVAWTYHDLLPAYLFPKAGARLRDWVTFLPARRADATIATNRGDYQRLAFAQSNTDHLHEIPIGSNVEGRTLTTDERRARRKRYGWDDHDFVLGYFGAINRSKGAMALLHTLEAVVMAGVNAHLLMIGDVLGASDPTNATYAEEVRSEVSALGLEGRIHWTGRESAEAVSADLNAVDICLLPYTDGASLRRGTLMAALANGCAIVTTAPEEPIAVLRDTEEALYIPRGDDRQVVTAAATAVLRLHSDDALRDRLGENARRASELFSWEKIARQHLAIYTGSGQQWVGK